LIRFLPFYTRGRGFANARAGLPARLTPCRPVRMPARPLSRFRPRAAAGNPIRLTRVRPAAKLPAGWTSLVRGSARNSL